MPEDSRRYISRIGQTEGPFSIDEIYDMIVARKLQSNTLFWSESKKAWKLIAGVMLDIDPDHLDQFIKDGVKKVRVQGSGPNDCYVCLALADKVFPIDKPPELPPVNCICVPWCRLVLTPVKD